jgi:alkyl hydroperoxide reductase subunit AhpC
MTEKAWYEATGNGRHWGEFRRLADAIQSVKDHHEEQPADYQVTKHTVAQAYFLGADGDERLS